MRNPTRFATADPLKPGVYYFTTEDYLEETSDEPPPELKQPAWADDCTWRHDPSRPPVPAEVCLYEGPSLVARHARSYETPQDLLDADQAKAVLERKRRAFGQTLQRLFLALAPEAKDWTGITRDGEDMARSKVLNNKLATLANIWRHSKK